MRLKLTLAVNPNYNRLPFNYFYPVSSWLYKQINHGNSNFARWLHEEGYTVKGKHFKDFTFSKIGLNKFRRVDGGLLILDRRVEIYISFLTQKGIESFLTGLFLNQKMQIVEGANQCRFFIERVETLLEPEFTDSMTFKTSSPIILSKPVIMNDKAGKEFLHPSHPEYGRRFLENLVFKYMAYHRLTANFDYSTQFAKDYSFKYFEPCKSRLVTIKANTPEATQVRGHFYSFKIHAPKELLQVGYYAGFGEKNSLGFGYVEVKE